MTFPRWVLVLLAITESCSWSCAQVPDGAYATANASCAALATSKAQAELCVQRVQQTWCGEGGLWSAGDGGICNDH